MRLLQTITVAFALLSSDAQERWINHTPDLFIGLAGNGKIVAAGEVIQTSTDGRNWTTLQEGPFYQIMAGAFGNGRFIMSDRKVIAESSDGSSWSYRTNFKAYQIIFAENKFWAIGTRPGEYDRMGFEGPLGVFVSDDGRDWRQMFRPDFNLERIVYGNGLFVTSVRTNTPAHDITRVYTSTNGTDWALTTTFDEAYAAVTFFARDRFFAVATSLSPGALLMSPDCISWTSLTVPTTNSVSCILWKNDHYIAFTWGGEVFVSADAQSWTLQTNLQTFGLGSPLETPHGILLFGAAGKIYFSPAEGEWQKISPAGDFPPRSLRKVAYWNQKFYGAGPQGVAVSPDGVAWNASLTNSGPIRAIVPANSNLYAFGTNRAFRLDDHGIWTSAEAKFYDPPEDIVFANKQFVAAASHALYTSQDGFHWEQTFTNWNFYFQHVAYGNGVYVAGGDRWIYVCPAFGDCQLPDPSTIPPEYAVASTNGVDWQMMDITVPRYPIMGLVFGNGKFVATYETYDPIVFRDRYYGVIRVSTNGFDWSTVPTSFPPPLPGGLAFANGLFFLLHYNGVSISRDAVDWEFHQANYSANSDKWLASIAYGKLRYVGVGGIVLTSDRELSFEFSTDGAINLNLTGGDIGDVAFEESNDLLNWEPLAGSQSLGGLSDSQRFFRAVSLR